MRNKILFVSICVIASLLILSCSKDSDMFRFSAIGTIESQNTIYLDFDKKLIHIQENIPAEFIVGDRVVASFELIDTISQITAHIVEIEKIPSETIIDITASDYLADTLFNNVTHSIKRMWISRDFLTVDFLFSGVDYDLHQFQLARIDSLNPPKQGMSKRDTITLNFRHYNGGDEKSSQIQQNLHSFNLSGLKPLYHDSVLLIIKTELYRTDTTSITDTRPFYYK